MKLCAVSDSFGNLRFEEAAKASADLGLQALEIGTGNWSATSHANLQSRLASIEHEDSILSRIEGTRRSVDLLKGALAGEPSDYALPAN
jgi:hypothetical protein